MNIYSDFDVNIRRLKQLIYNDIGEYGSSIRDVALRVMESEQILVKDRLPGGIALYIPFWLGDKFGLSDKMTEHLSLASFYLNLYIITKDGVIDNSFDDYRIALLSDRVFLSSIDTLRNIMGNNKLFWAHFNQSLEQTINFLAEEKERTIVESSISDAKCLREAIIRLRPSDLGAFLRPIVVGATILGKQENQIPPLCNAIDLYNISIKLVDDFVDWEDDLKRNAPSLFLNLARNWCGHENIQEIDVQRFIVGSDLAEMMLNESVVYMNEAKKNLENMGCRYFLSFLDNEYETFLRMKNELSMRRKIILRKMVDGLLFNHENNIHATGDF